MTNTLLKIGLIVAFFPLLISLIVFFILPDSIPTHFFGQITWSDKLSPAGIMAIFGLPVATILIGLVLYRANPWIKIYVKKNEQKADEKFIDMILPLVAFSLLCVHIILISLILSNV
ncbi:MAG: hypothetical protein FWC44_03225 [Methanomassiliicoccaceae archaeon]|nr:hypothetical protein [Methanomassiliicoccaceae archaeon]MCL2318050.1 hypothetical protein [Methanomassiliicoccaceae archaeon]